MKRREIITLLGSAAAAPFTAYAQQSERMRRVGVLLGFPESDSEAKAWLTAFEEGLQKLGWSQGRNLRIDYRWAGNNEARMQATSVRHATFSLARRGPSTHETPRVHIVALTPFLWPALAADGGRSPLPEITRGL